MECTSDWRLISIPLKGFSKYGLGFVLTSKDACFDDAGVSMKEDELVEEGIQVFNQSELVMPGRNGAVW